MLPLLVVVIGVVAFEAAAVLISTTLCAQEKKAKHPMKKQEKKGKVHPKRKGKKRRHGDMDIDLSPAVEAAVESNCWGCADGGGGGADGGGADGGGGGGGCGGGGGGG